MMPYANTVWFRAITAGLAVFCPLSQSSLYVENNLNIAVNTDF